MVRSQLDKVTAAAHARQKATFNPQNAATEIPKTSLPPKSKRRVSLGTVVDAETGELMISGKRHSQRSHTVLNTSTSDALFKVELKKKVRCCIACPGYDFHISNFSLSHRRKSRQRSRPPRKRSLSHERWTWKRITSMNIRTILLSKRRSARKRDW